MATHEYYDRNLPDPENSRLSPSQSQQEIYWLLRGRLTAALAANWDEVAAAAPAVGQAFYSLQRFCDGHPTRDFRVTRPEDHTLVHEGDARLVLR